MLIQQFALKKNFKRRASYFSVYSLCMCGRLL